MNADFENFVPGFSPAYFALKGLPLFIPGHPYLLTILFRETNCKYKQEQQLLPGWPKLALNWNKEAWNYNFTESTKQV